MILTDPKGESFWDWYLKNRENVDKIIRANLYPLRNTVSLSDAFQDILIKLNNHLFDCYNPKSSSINTYLTMKVRFYVSHILSTENRKFIGTVVRSDHIDSDTVNKLRKKNLVLHSKGKEYIKIKNSRIFAKGLNNSKDIETLVELSDKRVFDEDITLKDMIKIIRNNLPYSSLKRIFDLKLMNYKIKSIAKQLNGTSYYINSESRKIKLVATRIFNEYSYQFSYRKLSAYDKKRIHYEIAKNGFSENIIDKLGIKGVNPKDIKNYIRNIRGFQKGLSL